MGLVRSPGCLLRRQRLVLEVWLLVVNMPGSDETLDQNTHNNHHWPHKDYYATPAGRWVRIRVDFDQLEKEWVLLIDKTLINDSSSTSYSPILVFQDRA